MGTFREDMLDILDFTRGIPTDFDFRRYDVLIRIRQWSGSRPGLAGTTSVDIDIPILVNQDTNRPKVRLVTTQEVIASNGLYMDGDYLIGRITPQYIADNNINYGYVPDDLRPQVTTNAREIFVRLTGPGMPNGDWFKTIEVSVERNMHYTFVVRKTAQIL